MKIAVVENESDHAHHLRDLLLQWESENSTSLDISFFTSGEDLLAFDFLGFHLVFMDIQMDGMSGVELSQTLRSLHFEGEIVFLTSYSEYVFEGYDVRAMNYLMKPINFEKVSNCINRISEKFSEGYYIYSDQTTVVQIQYSKILYFYCENHYIQIVTADETFRQLESMKKVFATLPSHFLYCHRSIIVNMKHVSGLHGKEIILSNRDTLPVSSKYLQSIRYALITYADSFR